MADKDKAAVEAVRRISKPFFTTDEWQAGIITEAYAPLTKAVLDQIIKGCHCWTCSHLRKALLATVGDTQ
jgi:hypothetical protein